MKPLHVLLVIKATASAFMREQRNMGQFSYPVDQFTWEHMTLPKGGTINRATYAGKFDVIFHEDAPGCTYEGDGPPVIYYAIDSTLTDEFHFKPRHEQAKQANLVLVDHDRLSRFHFQNIPTRRLSYCVNDHLFYDRGLERDLDVVFHCPAGKYVPGGDERREIRQLLHEYCAAHGLTYVSGAVDLPTYAEHFARAKVVVSWSRTLRNRPHRVMDATASGACLVSSSIPSNEFETWINEVHYQRADSTQSIVVAVIDALTRWSGTYGTILASRGRDYVMKNHTWAIRAEQLRRIIAEEFGI